MTASAIIAAILPRNTRNNDEEEMINGSLTQSTHGDDMFSCKPSYFITLPCHDSIFSGTTVPPIISSIGEEPPTELNTTFFENLIYG